MLKIALFALAVSTVAAAYSDAKASPVYTLDGKQMSEMQRCGAEWKATKPHKDVRWPQYWSACAKAIKADNKSGAAKIGTMKIDLSVLPKVEPITVAK